MLPELYKSCYLNISFPPFRCTQCVHISQPLSDSSHRPRILWIRRAHNESPLISHLSRYDFSPVFLCLTKGRRSRPSVPVFSVWLQGPREECVSSLRKAYYVTCKHVICGNVPLGSNQTDPRLLSPPLLLLQTPGISGNQSFARLGYVDEKSPNFFLFPVSLCNSSLS